MFPLARGNNTVEVVIIDQKKQPADSELVQKVQTHIDPNSEGLGNGAAPIGAKCYVAAATGLSINVSARVTVSLSADRETVIQNIKDNITEYLESIAFVNDFVSFARIGEAIIGTEGVEDYTNLTVNGGTSNVEVTDKQVAILGGVTIE